MRGLRCYGVAGFVSAVWVSSLTFAAFAQDGKTIDLPTSKQLTMPVPGDPKRLNTLPMSIAVSPDKRYVVTLNAGYGTFESNYDQSLAVLDTTTGKVEDFPDSRTLARVAKQTLYSGLAFSKDGRHIYASMASTTDPLGEKDGDSGSGVAVYGFSEGKITAERMIKIPLQQLAPGKTTKILERKGGGDGVLGVPFPAAIAVIGGAGAERLLVADNLSDDVLLLDAVTGAVLKRFDLAETNNVPSVYPVALAVAKDEARAYVALWNSSEVVELDLKANKVGRKLALLKPKSPIAPGTHPCALDITADGKTMFVALSNRDAVAAIDLKGAAFAVKGYFDTRLPGQTYFGAEPAALAVSEDGRRLYVANMGSDALAVIDTAKLTKSVATKGFAEPVGFVPTEWMPMNVAFAGGKVYVATAKGKGTGPNNFPQRLTEEMKSQKKLSTPGTYIATLLYGSIATLDEAAVQNNLKASTAQVLESNRMKAAEEKIKFADGSSDRIKHVIYIIKENRTYDQILGDLSKDGKAVGNGDASLTMYGADIAPNEHALALRFGVLDNFFDSGEVSGDGHVWSNAAIGTDYLEKTWEQDYRGGERGYDFEGVVSSGYPLLQKIPDVNEPASGYLWTNLTKHGKTLYHFGEYISSVFCDEKHTDNPQDGPMLAGEPCKDPEIKPGQPLPANWGGGVNLWPWAIPRMAKNLATKPELVGHFAVEAPDFNLMVPDQIRVQIFEQHLKQWVSDRKAGHDTMPNFVMLRLANDHTAGTTPGDPTPKASVADNDLAVGRAVEMISHTKFWEDTAFFILEDDAQNGADHVDAHRSTALVVSKYSPKAADGGPFVDSRFYSTVSVIRTMETLLGIPPMNNNDALCSLINTVFTGAGDDAPYQADYRNRDNGLIYTANKKTAPGAKESMKMDFRHADRADAQKLNVVLWQDAMGGKTVPPMLMEKRKKAKKDDDD
ncbi:YVTN family beta-propeller protein [Granulicella aggregans]|uniref:YVTN family beta-propeller protein n=1 Tax=Granulicella aggregans TaxID=474949 RepID=A0A7W7ZGL6_9BACT|nr:bifunctional YncE family protein/alkaline phosphatase family protein [Granulicella aggregans]MBB5059565.1 YVTN family beta-propeller protein [Granulicella aggregans]